jgi:hypothetical protein
MLVVVEHCPSKTIDTRLGNQNRQTVQKVFPIIIEAEYFSPFDSPDDNMMQRPWGTCNRILKIPRSIADLEAAITLPSQWHRFTILVSKSVSGMSDTFF